MTKVGILVGSLSKNSMNRQLATALTRLAPEGLEFVDIDYSALPAYNHDHDGNYPAEAQALKAAIEDVDALLFVTPEYNRSIPGALKNAIDWASRPWGTNSFDGKPAAVIGTSPGGPATAMAQQHLRNVLSFLNVTVMGQPEGYIQWVEGVITPDGEVTDDSTADFLRDFMAAFAAHVAKLRAGELAATRA